jgi:zinc finger protein
LCIDLYLCNRAFFHPAEGSIYTVHVLSRKDLDRQIVKSETCTVTIPEYELTIPASKGQLTTIEGIIGDTIRDLSFDQPLRHIQDEDTFTKIQILIDKLKVIVPDEDDEGDGALTGAKKSEAPIPPFTIELDDPAGNSFIEFVRSMGSDPEWNFRTYRRTHKQNVALGLVDPDAPGDSAVGEHDDVTEAAPADDGNEEIYVFPGVCSSCGHPLDTMMKKVVIPYFKVSFPMICATTSHLSGRISSSCLPTATTVATGTTRSSQVQQFLKRGSASRLGLKIAMILAETS